jgi:EpsI family protein
MQAPAPALRNWLLSAGLIAITVLVYWPSTAALWEYWLNDNRSGMHGLLVAPLCAWLLYRARFDFARIQPRPSIPAGVLLFLGSLSWLVFWRAGIQELHLLMLPVLMGLAVWTVCGFRAALAVAFPIGYLYFAVPAWGIFGRTLQDITVWAMRWMAPLMGVHAQIHGDLVDMPGVGVIEIGSSCSGVNFFNVGLAVAALLGELERASILRRAVLLVAMGALSMFANWLRVAIIVEAGYSTHMRHVLVSRGHYTFGWVLFTIVMVTFVWFAARGPRAALSPAPTSSQGLLRAIPWPAYVATLLALVAAPVAVYTVVAGLDARAAPLAFAAPAGRGGWQGPGSSPWKPDFVGPHSQWSVAYQDPAGRAVEMAAIGYSTQGQGRELVNEENALFGSSVSLDTVAENKITLGQESYVETVVADDKGHRSLVWSVYDIGGRTFVTPLLSQLWYGVRSLGGPPYSVLYVFRTPCELSCDSARETLRSFVQSMGSAALVSAGRDERPLTARSGTDR